MNIIKSDTISLHGAAVSMQGGRPENQDDMAYMDTPLGFLLVVCDGMGGGPGGKTASYIAKYEIAKVLCECNPQTPREHAFKMAVAKAHEAIVHKMEEMPALNGMGSTFVAVLINSQSAIIAHAGDSRCYKLHGKRCQYRSNDHSLVSELVKKKVMTEEEARVSPQSNVVTRGLGSTTNHVPEIEEITYRKGDRFILCTDGVWGIMPHQDLLKAFTAQEDIQKLVADISSQIDNIGFSKGGGHDNHTIAIFEMGTDAVSIRPSAARKIILLSLATFLIVVAIAFGIWYILNQEKPKRQTLAETPQRENPLAQQTETHTFSAKDHDNVGQVKRKNLSSETESNQAKDDKKKEVKNEAGSIVANEDLLNTIQSRINEKTEKDSIAALKKSQQAEKKSTDIKETVRGLIRMYEVARKISEPKIDDARKKIDQLRKEVILGLDDLCKQTTDSKSRPTADGLKRVAEDEKSWYIDASPDPNSKKYVPTHYSKKKMEEQISRLKNLEKNLE